MENRSLLTLTINLPLHITLMKQFDHYERVSSIFHVTALLQRSLGHTKLVYASPLVSFSCHYHFPYSIIIILLSSTPFWISSPLQSFLILPFYYSLLQLVLFRPPITSSYMMKSSVIFQSSRFPTTMSDEKRRIFNFM